MIVGGHSLWFKQFFNLYLPFDCAHRSKKEKRGKKKADPDELSIPLMATQYGSTHDHNDHGHGHGHGHDEHDDHDDHHEKKR